MFGISDRFNIDYYLPKSRQSEENTFYSFISQYQQPIQKLLKNYSWQQVLFNKSLVQIFLDKTSLLLPSQHPVNKIAAQFEWNSSTFSSMEISRYLESILNCPELTTRSKTLIRQWLSDEKKYLPYAIFFDGVRLESNPNLSEEIKIGKVELKPFEIDEEVTTQLAEHLLNQLENLTPGESIKLLGGTVEHEVRLVIKKEKNFKITSYDSAKPTVEVSNIADEKILNINSLSALIQSKITSNTNDVLKTFGDLVEVDDLSTTHFQKRNSCPIHSILKEFKHFFANSFSSEEEGIEQYKIIKSLMATSAVQTEQLNVKSPLYEALLCKEEGRKRVLKWIQFFGDNPEKIQEVLNLYEKAIKSLEPNAVIDTNCPRIATIIKLDRQLKELSDKTRKIKAIKEIFEKSPIPVGVLLRDDAATSLILKVLNQTFNAEVSFKNKLLRLVKGYVPNSWYSYQEELISFDQITDFFSILIHKISTEEFNKLLKHAIDLKMINLLDLFYAIEGPVEINFYLEVFNSQLSELNFDIIRFIDRLDQKAFAHRFPFPKNEICELLIKKVRDKTLSPLKFQEYILKIGPWLGLSKLKELSIIAKQETSELLPLVRVVLDDRPFIENRIKEALEKKGWESREILDEMLNLSPGLLKLIYTFYAKSSNSSVIDLHLSDNQKKEAYQILISEGGGNKILQEIIRDEGYLIELVKKGRSINHFSVRGILNPLILPLIPQLIAPPYSAIETIKNSRSLLINIISQSKDKKFIKSATAAIKYLDTLLD